jgi:Trypsin-co-occurring domain 1
MDGDDGDQVVTARLASGAPVRVVLSEPESGDGMTSVGLRNLELDKALEVIGEIGSSVIGKLKKARATRATVELRLGFSVESGRLTALWVGGHAESSMTITLEWSRDQGLAAVDGNDRQREDGAE